MGGVLVLEYLLQLGETIPLCKTDKEIYKCLFQLFYNPHLALPAIKFKPQSRFFVS